MFQNKARKALNNILSQSSGQQTPDIRRSGTSFWLKRNTHLACFERDYPALLVVLSSMIKAGGDPFSCLLEARNMFAPESEMHRQLERVYDSIQTGDSEQVAVSIFANDLKFSEVSILKDVLQLGRQEGASLGPALMRLAKVTRQRQSFHRKARAALALQKLSSIGMLLCAISILIMQYFANPEALAIALSHPLGLFAITLGILAVLVGVGWMLKLSQSKIGV
jgi:Flp pilus assembly protein TadB